MKKKSKRRGFTLDDTSIAKPPYTGEGRVTPAAPPTLRVSRPRDRSFEAYKEWLTAFGKALTGRTMEMSEEQWRDGWTKFWT